ncbi:hypothetical protein V5P93_000905 [Actinokineospora auranticolor]|uniref:DUF6542 domain-containing protein n=1 Tax=Actinokineospora auranticolor TaxID=155976 RepID=UPI000CEB8C06|nr:DUF6542 domain-containing protein [Actinokineospora auranticolor]
MSASRDLDDDRAEPAWDERPILGRSRGLPWWGAVLLAFGLSAVAMVVDIQQHKSLPVQEQNNLGALFQITFVVACVAAVCLVRRSSLFAPMVQPPLVFAVVAVVGKLALTNTGGGGLRQVVLTVGLPLTSSFPAMAWGTGICVVLGVVRLFTQRDPNPPTRPASRRPTDDRPARTSGSSDRPGSGRSGADRPRSTAPRTGSDRPGNSPRQGERGGSDRASDRRTATPSRRPAPRSADER